MTMHFFAAIRAGKDVVIRRISVQQSLQDELSEEFNREADEFQADDLTEVAFDSSYHVDESEIFVIEHFELAADIVAAAKTPSEVEELVLADPLPTIKSIFASTYDPDSPELVVRFQAFTRTRLLKKNRFTLLFAKNTFHRLTEAGLTLDSKLAVLYQAGKLYFRSFKLASSCLDLTEYYDEASDDQIEEILGHDIWKVEDLGETVKSLDGWMRRRFAALRDSGILDQVTPRKVYNKAQRFGLDLKTVREDGQDRLVFPAAKKQAKEMLIFLNEGYFEGELTGSLYMANSQRKI